MTERMEAFLEEAQELLGSLEAALLEAEAYHGLTVDSGVESVNAIFRCLHTLKGIAGMVGFNDLVGLANDLESVYSRVRSGDLHLDGRLTAVTFRFQDLVQRFLLSVDDGLDFETAAAIGEELSSIYDSADACPQDLDGDGPAGSGGRKRLYRLRYEPRGALLLGASPETVLDHLRALGEAYFEADLSELPNLEDIDPEVCHLAWDILLATDKGEDALNDVLFLADGHDGCLTWSEESDTGGELATQPPPTHDLYVPPLPSRPASVPSPTVSAVSAAPVAEPGGAERRAAKPGKTAETSSIRVPSDKLDDLVDLVGRVVISQVRLRQIESELADPRLTAVAEEMERLGDMLRDRALSLRMLPIGGSFARFRRLVRDLSCELCKEVDLMTSGEETELDKIVIERLGDPLVHILRNCLDHGLEPPDEREAAGKPRRGAVLLAARQEGGRVHIEISDDGRGIDADKVLAKAVASGLTKSEPRPSDEEIYGFIFHPGFSTAEHVTAVSGRGVGMDVVRKAVEALKGTVRVASSPGAGTTITVSLPLTLAIIDGLHVRVGDELYVLPLSEVVECVETARDSEDRKRTCCTLDIRGSLTSCLSLRRFFGVPGDEPPLEQVVVVNTQAGTTGLIVDEIIGQHQTVIKGLGRLFGGLKGVSGATIMGDGSLALILDIASLLRAAQE